LEFLDSEIFNLIADTSSKPLYYNTLLNIAQYKNIKFDKKTIKKALFSRLSKILISIQVSKTRDNYVVYVNNPDGTLAAADNSIEGSSVLYTETIQAGTGRSIITGTRGRTQLEPQLPWKHLQTVGMSFFSNWTSTGGGQFANTNNQ